MSLVADWSEAAGKSKDWTEQFVAVREPRDVLHDIQGRGMRAVCGTFFAQIHLLVTYYEMLA